MHKDHGPIAVEYILSGSLAISASRKGGEGIAMCY